MVKKNKKEINEKSELQIVHNLFKLDKRQGNPNGTFNIKGKKIGSVVLEVLNQGEIIKDRFRKSGKDFNSYVISDLGNYLAVSYITNNYEEQETKLDPELGRWGGWESNYKVNFEIFKKGKQIGFFDSFKYQKYPRKNCNSGNSIRDEKVLLKGTKLVVSRPILGLEQKTDRSYDFCGKDKNNYHNLGGLIKYNSEWKDFRNVSLKEFIDSTINKYDGLPKIFDTAIKNA